jgi:hypothetical protein
VVALRLALASALQHAKVGARLERPLAKQVGQREVAAAHELSEHVQLRHARAMAVQEECAAGR